AERHKNGDANPSLRIDRERQRIRCFSQGCFDRNGKQGADVYGLVMVMERVNFKTALRKLEERAGVPLNGHAGNGRVNAPPRITATFDYRDESGKLLYQVVRKEPGKNGRSKDFVIRKPDGKGGWKYTGKEVSKVLYRLPDILKAGGSDCGLRGRGLR
ncbi:MAG: hypothetical protein O3B73_10155, partial [bacterium]|nr:hypothetical protein [bacterium]